MVQKKTRSKAVGMQISMRSSMRSQIVKRLCALIFVASPVISVQSAIAADREVVFWGGKNIDRTINLFVDGRYGGSLRSGDALRTRFCTGRAYVVEWGFGETSDRLLNQTIEIGATQVLPSAYEITASGRNVYLQPLSEAPRASVASSAGDYKRTVISRIQREVCSDAPPAVVSKSVQPKTSSNTRWSAPHILFDFRKSHLSSRTVGGQMEQVINLMRNRFASIERVWVRGFSDAEGSEQNKYAISLERAQMVANGIRRHGLSVGEMLVSGESDSKDAGADCGVRNLEQRRKCNQLNRRVEIEVEGVLR